MSASVDRWISGDGCRLAARVWSGSLSPIVLLHGATSTLEEWWKVAPALAAQGHVVVAYDARAHGHSESHDDLTFAAQARDLACVIRECGLAEPVVVGASMGAMVGLEHAVASGRVSGLVSLDGPIADLADRVAAGQPPPDEEAQQAFILAHHYDAPATEFEEDLGHMLVAAPWINEASRRRQHPIVDGRAVRRPLPHQSIALHRYVHEQPSTRLLAAVPCKTLLVMASRPEPDDEAGRARTAARRAVAARIANPLVEVRWVETGHQVAGEAPELVVELIRAFAQQ